MQRAVNQSTLNTLRDYSLIALAAIFLISVLIGWFVAGRLLRPIGEITRTANRLRASDLSQRINATGPRDELRTLADTIDDMLDRLDNAFRSERGLVEDVSHELRNPVAVVQANVEAVLANEDATASEREHALAVITRATSRMSRLLEDLLATARRRSGAFADQNLDLNGFVNEVVDEHRLLADERPLDVTTRIAHGPVVYADPESLARALANLLSNAIRLAPAHSTLTVASGSVGGWAWIAVQDEGPGIAEVEQQGVFDRFRRATKRRQRVSATEGVRSWFGDSSPDRRESRGKADAVQSTGRRQHVRHLAARPGRRRPAGAQHHTARGFATAATAVTLSPAAWQTGRPWR